MSETTAPCIFSLGRLDVPPWSSWNSRGLRVLLEAHEHAKRTSLNVVGGGADELYNCTVYNFHGAYRCAPLGLMDLTGLGLRHSESFLTPMNTPGEPHWDVVVGVHELYNCNVYNFHGAPGCAALGLMGLTGLSLKHSEPS